MSKRFGAVLSGGLLLTASVALGAATLDVKPGLWEMTSVGQTSGRPPIPAEVLAKLTPEQRAKVEQAMAASMAQSNKPHVTRSCITQKTIDRGFSFEDRPNCKSTVLNSTPSTLDVAVQCTGQEKMTGKYHFVASDRQTVNGNFDMAVSDGTNTMTMKYTLGGKWLGGDCGNVKPAEE